ncbi:SAM-dependent methyltransferase [Geothermobacter hydrogeniphilus]|uniref:SAM-dependent methyltransferase n=1 Tax=Geothermobacter hydrogeniphilus TaxID=1969733 RepID=A0A2K2HDT6_9BACT|nr:SAM-dependent methyltransferase [Geothermobacter hydrogeniphilus]PNU21450.1 SAM-dependent methyltransferase [Geothermobacter hydrogeniphilus]
MMTDLPARLLAAVYDRALAASERRFLSRWRRELLAGVSGTVLEVGSGTGLNLPHYPVTVERLVLSEPDPYMRVRLEKKLDRQPTPPELLTCGAEQLDFPDRSFDAVISTLVLCSVKDPAVALREIHRVLRPGGRLYFLEHVLSEHPGISFWQHTLEPLWKRTCGNCHLTRATGELIGEAGFELETMEDLRMEGVPVIVRRALRGVAVKPAAGA